MTGSFDDGPSGIFDHLDDPGAPTPSADVLSSVVHRGARLRARRQSLFAATGAAAVTAAVFGGLGISHGLNAQSNHDRLVSPATSGTPSASASAKSGHHHHSGDAVLVPKGPTAGSPIASAPPPSPTPSAPPPCEEPSASPTPTPGGIIVPPLVPTWSPAPVCGTPSPTPSESPNPSDSPTQSDSATPTPSPTPT
jgi:hypothetical protein